MSDATTHLLLPYILAVLAQKHVTHNEAMRILDGHVQLSVLGPAPDRAARQSGLWRPLHRRLGRDRRLSGVGPECGAVGGRHLAASAAADRLAGVGRGRGLQLVYDGAGWIGTTPVALQNMALLGFGTTADASNPFSAKLNAAL